MANTKDTLIIVGTALDEAKFASGRTVTTAEIAKYGLTLGGDTNANGFTTGNVADSAGAISTQDDVYTLDAYGAATQGVTLVDTSGVATGEELFVTLIDVTDGRRQFPRKTFRAATAAALATVINGAEIETGDGFGLTCTEAAGVLTITFAADRIVKTAANDDSAITDDGTGASVVPVLSTGLTNKQAQEFVANKVTKAGRTNRVGFPVIEPNVFTDLGLSTSANYDVLTKQIVGDVKFDKNVGASYQDVEYVTVIVADAATMTNS